MYEYTFHPLEIQETDELPAGEIVQIDPDELFEMLGEMACAVTMAKDDATLHLMYLEYPIRPVEVSDEE